jgi:hypothetical protein
MQAVFGRHHRHKVRIPKQMLLMTSHIFRTARSALRGG